LQVAGYGNSYIRGNGEQTRITPAQIEESVNNSLARLGTDYIDLLQIHWPDRFVPLFGASSYDQALERETDIPFEEQLRGRPINGWRGAPSSPPPCVRCSARPALAWLACGVREQRWRRPAPRLAGGDFGLWRHDFEAVNGFDERFVGWGQEDDDLGLRLRAAGIRLESVLDLTSSLHVWHPTDPSATPRWRDGANVNYFGRRGRLSACREGLVRRENEAISWGEPSDIGATPLGRSVHQLLASASLAAPGAGCEIDLIVAPSTTSFSRPSECRLLLVPAGTTPTPRLVARADRVVEVAAEDPQVIADTLAAIG
jgi:hypothetical protein